MAKADDKSSTTDRIWLSTTLDLAVRRFGKETLAKRRLIEWLATGRLPWSCGSWYGPDAETIARLAHENAEKEDVGYFEPSGLYRGDPKFWGAPTLETKWQENKAGEIARGGARAEGIWVMHSRLLALLPKKLREREETPELTDAEVPTPSANAPAASPAPPMNISEAELRECLLFVVMGHPPNTTPLSEDELIKNVEGRLGAPVSRDRIQQVRDEIAPGFKLKPGRPRKSAQ